MFQLTLYLLTWVDVVYWYGITCEALYLTGEGTVVWQKCQNSRTEYKQSRGAQMYSDSVMLVLPKHRPPTAWLAAYQLDGMRVRNNRLLWHSFPAGETIFPWARLARWAAKG